MTDEMQTLRDDIAYLKNLADGGRDGSAEGGWILIAAGGLYSLASLAQWAALQGLVTGMVSNGAWLAALALFFITLFAVKSRTRRTGGRSAAVALAWQGVGWALFVMFAAIALATWRIRSPLLIEFSPSIVMALYGAAWSVAAVVTRKAWQWAAMFGSFIAALISAWLIGDTAQWLVYAGALVLLAFVPGVVFVLGRRGDSE